MIGHHLTAAELAKLVAEGKLEQRPCKRCPKKIYFAPDAEGKIQVLDAVAPVYRLAVDGLGEVTAVRTVAFVSHFCTCPQANSFSSSNRVKE